MPKGRLTRLQRNHCRRLRAGGWRHFRCKPPKQDCPSGVCALCEKEQPTFEHAALRCPVMAKEREVLLEIVRRWQPRCGPHLAEWLMQNPPDRRGLAALCGIVSPAPGVAALPPPDRVKLACELAAASADLSRAYMQRANVSGAPFF